MKDFLNRLHARVGDLWWYSAMIFIACRSGDVIQAFIGLWLVPKYVGPNELGAVLPLQQLANFLTIPIAVTAIVFTKYVNTYAARGERGKVKSFIHDVLVVSALLFLICIAAAYLLIPHFYERLNVSAGSLTALVLAAGFTANISNLFSSALQGLKKFTAMTVQTLISAPIRLVTLLIAMPFRPLSGYLLGQTTPATTCSIFAVYSLHKDLKQTTPDPTWRKDLPEILHYLWPVAIYTTFSTLFGTITLTIYRQRLPELESSAYYLLSRFAEIAGYIGASLSTVLIPIASESHEQGKDPIKLLNQSLWGIGLFGLAFAAVFHLLGGHLFACVHDWRHYAEFANLLPLLSISTSLSAAICAVCSYEMACRRFAGPFGIIVMNLLWTVFLVTFTGYGYFRGILPNQLVDWMGSLHIASLKTLTFIGIPFGLLQLVFLFAVIRRRSKADSTAR